MPVPLQISMATGDLGEDEVETHGGEEAEEEVVEVAVAGVEASRFLEACTFSPMVEIILSLFKHSDVCINILLLFTCNGLILYWHLCFFISLSVSWWGYFMRYTWRNGIIIFPKKCSFKT